MASHDLSDIDAIANTDLLVQVAEKYYLEQLTQSQIAEIFGISRSTISRLLTRAREDGIVRIEIIRQQVRRPDLELQLTQRYQLQEAIVIGLSPWPAHVEAQRNAVGAKAAPYVDAMIKPNMMMGVGRGRTLAYLATALCRFATPRNIKLVQILGDIDIHHSAARATEITRLLSESYAGAGYYLNAPALVADENLAEILMQSSNIAQVSELYDQLDLALVGIGALHNSPLVLGGLLQDSDIDQLARAGAVGDICGHFYTGDGELVDHAYTGRSIGISWQQLHNCRRLIAIATGDDKIQPLLGLLRICMLDVLITDAGAAQQILAA